MVITHERILETVSQVRQEDMGENVTDPVAEKCSN
jgi:hypothetical protein